MVPLEGEAGFVGVIKIFPFDGSEIGVTPLVLDVAYGAVIGRGLAMEPFPGGDAVTNLIVADQTPIAIDLEIVVVAAVAAFRVFKALVGQAEPTGHEIDVVFLGMHQNGESYQDRRQNDHPGSVRPPH